MYVNQGLLRSVLQNVEGPNRSRWNVLSLTLTCSAWDTPGAVQCFCEQLKKLIQSLRRLTLVLRWFFHSESWKSWCFCWLRYYYNLQLHRIVGFRGKKESYRWSFFAAPSCSSIQLYTLTCGQSIVVIVVYQQWRHMGRQMYQECFRIFWNSFPKRLTFLPLFYLLTSVIGKVNNSNVIGTD